LSSGIGYINSLDSALEIARNRNAGDLRSRAIFFVFYIGEDLFLVLVQDRSDHTVR